MGARRARSENFPWIHRFYAKTVPTSHRTPASVQGHPKGTPQNIYYYIDMGKSSENLYTGSLICTNLTILCYSYSQISMSDPVYYFFSFGSHLFSKPCNNKHYILFIFYYIILLHISTLEIEGKGFLYYLTCFSVLRDFYITKYIMYYQYND